MSKDAAASPKIYDDWTRSDSNNFSSDGYDGGHALLFTVREGDFVRGCVVMKNDLGPSSAPIKMSLGGLLEEYNKQAIASVGSSRVGVEEPPADPLERLRKKPKDERSRIENYELFLTKVTGSVSGSTCYICAHPKREAFRTKSGGEPVCVPCGIEHIVK